MLLCRVACGQMFRMLRPDHQLVDQVIGTTASAVLGDREARLERWNVGWWNNHHVPTMEFFNDIVIGYKLLY